MKTFRILAAVAALVFAAPAIAQQVQNHAIPIGKGAGVTGFGAAVPGTAGRPLISNGAASDPSFGTIGNAGFTPGAANTVKGTIDGVNVSDLPLPSCTAASSALKYTSGVGVTCSPIQVTTGFDMPINLGLSASASAGALTINLTQANGSAPTSGAPVLVPFRSLTITSGAVNWVTISSAMSAVIPSGATMGVSGASIPFRIWIFMTANSAGGGLPALGVALCSNPGFPGFPTPCASWEQTLKATAPLNTSSDFVATLYAGGGFALDAVRIVGFCDFGSGLAAPGTWATSCTSLNVLSPSMKKPGEVVQYSYASTGTQTTNSSTTKTATALFTTVDMTSAANFVRVKASGNATQSSVANTNLVTLWRGTGSVQIGNTTPIPSAAGRGAVELFAMDAPGVVGTVQYGVYIQQSTGGNTGNFNDSGIVPNTATMLVEEIQG